MSGHWWHICREICFTDLIHNLSCTCGNQTICVQMKSNFYVPNYVPFERRETYCFPFFRFRFFCFFSAKFFRTITFLSFQICQLYLVCGCMTIMRCVAYRNDLRGTLTSRSNNCFLNSIFLSGP